MIKIAIQILTRLEHLHNKGFVHRDIKPDNFLIGLNKLQDKIYMIDYGLAKRYMNTKTQQHVPFAENRGVHGTSRYISTNGHLGFEQSRRDDIESLAYVLLYFINGSLPWLGIKAGSKQEKMERIFNLKMSTPVEALCKGLPSNLIIIAFNKI